MALPARRSPTRDGRFSVADLSRSWRRTPGHLTITEVERLVTIDLSRSPSALAPAAPRRLRRQGRVAARQRRASDGVAWFGAVQAQEYALAKWALARRTANETTDATIQRSLDEGRIVRTHVLRP